MRKVAGEVPGAAVSGRYQAKRWRGSSHEIARRIAETLPEGSKILDVGSATGMLGSALPPTRFRIVGIEPDPASARAAAEHYERVFVGTLEEAPDDVIRAFDLVVCCDVLEHMADPEGQLQRLVQAQGRSTKFLVSVPNVAHLWLRINLLVGRFDYTDRGILDRTHLRFFTRKGLLAMIAGAGLSPLWVRPTPVPLELVHTYFLESAIGRLLSSLQQGAVAALPRLLGYQFICLARPKGPRDE